LPFWKLPLLRGVRWLILLNNSSEILLIRLRFCYAFFILLFRLNVYDTLDDFYDSYYIFIGDFDDDEYFNELFFSMYSVSFYDYDVNDDRIYSLEEENEFFLDFFYIYFIYWAKFFSFIFFILEEILRISLAFYICYLIVFEVHAVNASYIEDSYMQQTRSAIDLSEIKPKTVFKL